MGGDPEWARRGEGERGGSDSGDSTDDEGGGGGGGGGGLLQRTGRPFTTDYNFLPKNLDPILYLCMEFQHVKAVYRSYI